uniref:Uncharacterized protein n=1 Tax=Mustela putorius furo TaxID=9669 RepID=M3Z0Y8_MUSPF
ACLNVKPTHRSAAPRDDRHRRERWRKGDPDRTQKDDRVRWRGEDHHLQAQERGLGGSQLCPHRIAAFSLQPPERRGSECLLFKLLRLWCLLRAGANR